MSEDCCQSVGRELGWGRTLLGLEDTEKGLGVSESTQGCELNCVSLKQAEVSTPGAWSCGFL